MNKKEDKKVLEDEILQRFDEYCDRILFESNNNKLGMMNNDY